MNLSIPIFYSGKDGFLEVKEGPDVKWSGSADEARILTSCELALLVEQQCVEALADRLLCLLRGTTKCILTLLT